MILIVLSPSHLNAEMYKWVDDQGRIHYGDKPKSKSTAIHVKPAIKHQSKAVKSTNNSRSQSTKPTESKFLTKEKLGQEQYEKAKNMTYKDLKQYQAKITSQDEENRLKILQHMDEEQARYKKESKERQRQFEELEKQNEAAQKKLYGNYSNPSPEVNEFFEKLRSDSKRSQNNYNPDIYDGNGDISSKPGKSNEKNDYQKLIKAQKRKERRRKEAEKIGTQQQRIIQQHLNRQY